MGGAEVTTVQISLPPITTEQELYVNQRLLFRIRFLFFKRTYIPIAVPYAHGGGMGAKSSAFAAAADRDFQVVLQVHPLAFANWPDMLVLWSFPRVGTAAAAAPDNEVVLCAGASLCNVSA